MQSAIEKTLYFIAQKGWAQGDETFFSNLVTFLGETLDFEYVVIDEVIEGGTKARTVGLYARGAVRPNIEYALRSTPCEDVFGGALCFYGDGVQQHFPEDELLVDMGVESYLGVPLWGSSGEAIGLIALMGCRPFDGDRRIAESVLQVVAVRCAHEMERKRSEESLRESEARFRENFEHAVVGMAVVTPELRFAQVNPALQRMFGYTESEMREMSIRDVTVPDDESSSISTFQKAISGDFDERTIEKRYLTKSGAVIDALVSFRIVRGVDGQALHSIAQVVDITEQKRVMAERARLNDQLRQRQKMEALGCLAGGIAHDFNNILGAIVGFTELVIGDLGPDSPSTEDLREVLAASDRARDLIRRILAFSRPEMSDPKPVVMRSIVEEALRLLRPTLPSSVDIRVELDTSDAQVMADATQLHQIVMNLGTNATHALQPEGGTLIVSVSRVEGDEVPVLEEEIHAPHGFVRLSVEDTGVGIAEDDLARVFEPFFTTKRPGSGTGMGLSVVHGIVTSHGGFVRLDSKRGHGTRFDVYLPRVEESMNADLGTDGETPRGIGRVLVVDDEPVLAKLMTRTLTALGYEVEQTTSSTEALSILEARAHDFDLLFSDQTMPSLSGLELTKRALMLRPELPVILYTGYSDVLDEQSAQAAGARALLYKPVSRALLTETVQRVLQAPTSAAWASPQAR